MSPGTYRRLVETELGSVHVVVRSGVEGGRPVLFLHMSPKSGRMYHAVMNLLDQPAAAIDRPGAGASDTAGHAPSMTDYARSSLAVADALGWDHFDVVGTHTGSVEAVEIATLAPDRVGTVVIVAIPAYTADEIAERRGGVGAPRAPLDIAGEEVREMWRRRVALRRSPVDLVRMRDLFVDEVASMPTVHQAYEAVLAYPMLERLASLRRLVVFAPHDDLWGVTRRAREALPDDVVFVELPDLDFDLWESAPERMAHLLATHL